MRSIMKKTLANGFSNAKVAKQIVLGIFTIKHGN